MLFKDYINELKNMPMEGTKEDIPEGSRYVRITATAWSNILNELEKMFKDEKNIDNLKSVKPGYSFGGTDTKVYFNEKLSGYCQNISFNQNKYDTTGSLTMLITEDNKEELHINDNLQLKIIATNEFGKTVNIFNEQIQIKNISFSVTVDDLVLEKIFDWEVIKDKKNV